MTSRRCHDEARGFALEHAHYTRDIPFWRAAAARLGSPVLDLGCATGRVALPLARDGAEVWALDRSPAMLAELERLLRAEPPEVRERVRVVRGELAGFRLARTFRLVLIAMNTLQALTEPADRLACLSAVREHLAPGGELIFDVALPDAEEISATLGVERPGGLHHDPGSGATLEHSAWYDRWEPGTHTLEFTLRVERRADGGPAHTVLRHHRVHLFTQEEIRGLLQAAGLEPIEVLGDFDGSSVTAGSERQIHRCRAAA
jgi:SAM-dependent methyltransferase